MLNKQSLPELLQYLTAQETEKVKLAITDIDGVLRGKIISFEKFNVIAEKGFGFCDVVFGWDSGDQVYDNGAVTGLHTGYPDAVAVIDPGTFRQVPWEDALPLFLADFKDGSICPRGILKKVIGQMYELGYTAYFSQEFEWFNFVREGGMGQESKGIGSNEHAIRELKPMSQGMFGYSVLRASQGSAYFHDLFDGLKKFGVPLEGLHTETGPGVYEAAITYADTLEAADRAVLFKAGVKEIAYRHGIIPTFMAKYNESLPGCSGHVHQSLWSADRSSNLFFDKDSASRMSKLMESYIAGQLFCLPHILPMYAPTVNSYKRLVEGAWAPTTLTWAIDNRTTSLRALPGGERATRLETRVVGSDSNPYLAMAACLASGLYGIRNQLPLMTPATVGSGYADLSNGILPRNLWDATQAMKQSSVAAELFGAPFVDHFTRTREWEWRQFARVVTDWELKRYFEII
jgi:glutamine synthetase